MGLTKVLITETRESTQVQKQIWVPNFLAGGGGSGDHKGGQNVRIYFIDLHTKSWFAAMPRTLIKVFGGGGWWWLRVSLVFTFGPRRQLKFGPS